ncbi:NfeD family protein [Ancylomarina longa]|uniref:Serine protease n=1 Tax=Ancylomarina longa TaxID=2487017 RepID=A0A434AVY6_9BACT|nr:NfeD family protein [Ancylomarina longa]RUT78534.1 serine protease [Ancylomarina longa]
MTIFIIVLLIVFGIVLLLLEFLVIPGITLAALAGILMIGGGIYLSYEHYGNLIGNITVLSTLILSVSILALALKSKTWNRIKLQTEVDSKITKDEVDDIVIGDQGLSVSRLAPMGKIKVNKKILEAKSTGVYIDEKTKVEVVGIIDKIIIVKPI